MRRLLQHPALLPGVIQLWVVNAPGGTGFIDIRRFRVINRALRRQGDGAAQPYLLQMAGVAHRRLRENLLQQRIQRVAQRAQRLGEEQQLLAVLAIRRIVQQFEHVMADARHHLPVEIFILLERGFALFGPVQTEPHPFCNRSSPSIDRKVSPPTS